MYAWVWRRLPGGLPGKIVGSLALVAAAVIVLFLVVFPWVSPRLPANQVTVDRTPSSHPSPATPTPRP